MSYSSDKSKFAPRHRTYLVDKETAARIKSFDDDQLVIRHQKPYPEELFKTARRVFIGTPVVGPVHVNPHMPPRLNGDNDCGTCWGEKTQTRDGLKQVISHMCKNEKGCTGPHVCQCGHAQPPGSSSARFVRVIEAQDLLSRPSDIHDGHKRDCPARRGGRCDCQDRG